MIRSVKALVLVAVAVACGGDSPAGPGGGLGGGTGLTARVDGGTFTADAGALANHSFTGGYVISSASSASGGRGITILLSNIPGPGTYPLGTGAGVAGGTAIYVAAGAGWSTPLSGEAGTIVLTTVSDTRIAGTFSFTADGSTGGATGTRSITNGSFDLPVTTTGSPGTVLARNMNVVKGTFGGQSYNASTIATGFSSGSIIVSAINTKYAFSFSLSNATGPGTFSVGGSVLSVAQVGAPVGASSTGPLCCWSSLSAGSTGSVTLTALTPTSATGTFSFTLQPSAPGGATAPMTIANGTFSIAW